MIRREDLLSIARFKGLAPRLAELDYLQDVALINLSREFGNKLVFKGGTCLYKAYKLNRFSEDLDFTARTGFRQRDFFHRLPYFFGLLNLKGKISVEQFQNNMNARLEIIGPLYEGGKETAATLTFNISFRERMLLPVQRFPYSPIYPELRPFDLFIMDKAEILAEKVRAIYERNKARDVYDMWYLLERMGLVLDVGMVNKKLHHNRKLKFETRGFLAKLDEKKTGWERDLGVLVAGELLPFAEAKREIEKSILVKAT